MRRLLVLALVMLIAVPATASAARSFRPATKKERVTLRIAVDRLFARTAPCQDGVWNCDDYAMQVRVLRRDRRWALIGVFPKGVGNFQGFYAITKKPRRGWRWGVYMISGEYGVPCSQWPRPSRYLPVGVRVARGLGACTRG